jgi:hypothetical protein
VKPTAIADAAAFAVALAALPAILGCAELPPATELPAPARPGYEGYSSAKYADGRAWLCRPDLADDRCRADLTATEIHADGSRTILPFTPAADPKVDCFYVYPTVDLGLRPANHTDFTDVGPMANTTIAQVGRLGEVCRLFAPLYRQVTIGTYVFEWGTRDRRLSIAFSDVADAFAHYLGQYNQGRKIVLIGHSQGAEMVSRLVRRFFEGDPLLRERLLLALPIGGDVDVPPGRVAGGTFPTVPVCTRPDETGCVIAYRSHHGGEVPSPGRSAPPPGREVVCVNPASLDAGSVGGSAARPFARTIFPTTGRARGLLHGVEGISTPFVAYDGFYSGRCADGPGGYHYLEVSETRAEGDVRVSPFELDQIALSTSLGTHILDLQFPQGDLVRLIARRAAALP